MKTEDIVQVQKALNQLMIGDHYMFKSFKRMHTPTSALSLTKPWAIGSMGISKQLAGCVGNFLEYARYPKHMRRK